MANDRFQFLTGRCRQHEWMDDDAVDERQLHRSLRFIERVNRWLGYTRATLHHLQQFSAGWKSTQTIHLLDLATGSADVPRAMLRWARRRGFDLRITAVDRHPATTRFARQRGEDANLTLLQADVLSLPFEPGAFDYVTCSMFLHHLDEPQVVRVIQTMDRLARRGIIIADLLRHRRAYAWVRIFTALSNPMARHDAAASVAQAFTREEILALRDHAGIGYAQYYRHFGHRFVLAGERC